MKKFVVVLLWLGILFAAATPALAVVDPLSVPNNKFGIHILFPSELPDAARLVNTAGGNWGYVTIPIQAGDKNLQKWQAFMNQAKQLHLIPIIRLATEGDYFNTTVWRKPTEADVLDFANFLNSLNWPTKNRYIVVFNEVNRADEWGGQANPVGYADILSYAITAFKAKSPDFFIISAGLDNAASNTGSTYNEYTFLQDLNAAIPGIFNQVDGIASHAYPNPGFSEPPSVQTAESIDSFAYEHSYIAGMSDKNLPTFITETGWSDATTSPTTIASYFQQALATTWNDGNIVAITPFLLRAGGGPFTQFSFLDESGKPTPLYTMYANTPKVAGQPALAPSVLAAATRAQTLPVKDFSNRHTKSFVFAISQGAKTMLKWFLHM